MPSLIATTSITINASAAKVWEALTTPELISQYLYGTEVTSDWEEGSSIVYKGEWQGKPYEDKGKIVKIVPEKLLATTYWSGISGTEDKPENYANVNYELEGDGDGTKVTVTQDNIADEETKTTSENNWGMVLLGLK